MKRKIKKNKFIAVRYSTIFTSEYEDVKTVLEKLNICRYYYPSRIGFGGLIVFAVKAGPICRYIFNHSKKFEIVKSFATFGDLKDYIFSLV